MSTLLTLVPLLMFALGYRFYARWLGNHVLGDRDSDTTPAHTQRDDHDFVPTRPAILFGHHFTSIAGAAPILGPCVAAYWGWLPALAWIVLGTIFMGAVHDFGALVISVREKGRSIGDIAGKVLGKRAQSMFLVFVLLLVWLVLAVFAMAIASLFVSQPTSVLPIHSGIGIALVVGWLLYRRQVKPLWPSLIALVALYLFVGVGMKVPVDLASWGLSPDHAHSTWVIVLLVYAAIASLLPVWMLLQPRDYINSHQLLVGLGLLIIGIFVAHPPIEAPVIRLTQDAPPLMPLLFVTIACGAISGFHGLVASGTTSKQLDRLSDARAIGYGSMLGEGTLALVATIAAVAGLGLAGHGVLPSQGEVSDLSWHTYYDSWSHSSQNKAAAFVLGGGAFLQSLGIPATLSRTLIAVLVISFASTSLDTAARVQRLILAELGKQWQLPLLRRRDVGTAIAIVPAWLLTLGSIGPSDAQGSAKELGWALWPIFGASNQMLAALSLIVMALYLKVRAKPSWPFVIPMLFVSCVTLGALGMHTWAFLHQERWLLGTLALLMLALMISMLFHAGRLAWSLHQTHGRSSIPPR